MSEIDQMEVGVSILKKMSEIQRCPSFVHFFNVKNENIDTLIQSTAIPQKIKILFCEETQTCKQEYGSAAWFWVPY